MEIVNNIKFSRKIKINDQLIKLRWFYLLIVFLIFFFQQNSESLPRKETFFAVFVLVVFLYFVNGFFYFFLNYIVKKGNASLLNFLSFAQIFIEVIVFILIVYYTGVAHSPALYFFFFPIITASLIYGAIGAILTSLLVVICLNSYVVLLLSGIFGQVGVDIVGSGKIINYTITELASPSIFYLLAGIFAGLGANLLSEREKFLSDNNIKLRTEKDSRNNEIEKLDRTAQLLVRRDLELTSTNKELDKKVDELEKSKESLLKAYKDVQESGQKLEEERNKTLTILSNFTSPIIVMDADNKISLFNPAARKHLGVKFLDYGRRILPDNNYSLDNFKDILRIEHVFSVSSDIPEDPIINIEELSIKNTENQNLTFKVITAKILGNVNENLGIMKIFYDVSREKELDNLKSQFISVAAHQLRTPLAALKWIFELVLSGDLGDLNDEQRKFLSKGHESNERIINLVNDLLNVSRIEEKKFSYILKNYDFLELLDTVISDLDSIAREKKISITVNRPSKLNQANMDKEKMSMVLQNVIDNAIKYTPEYGKIIITVKNDERYINLVVEDKGVGIPASDMERLFSKFFRGANVVRMQTEGSGLGLYIVKEIIDKHKGTIGVESEEGKGTKVTIRIPFNN